MTRTAMIFSLAALLAVGGILVWLLLGDAAGAMSLIMPAILLVGGGAMQENTEKRRAQKKEAKTAKERDDFNSTAVMLRRENAELREKMRDRTTPPAPPA